MKRDEFFRPVKMEKCGVQKAGKSVTQSSQVRKPVVVAHGLTSGFPDVFLRIKVRTSGGEVKEVAAWPGRTVKEKQNGLSGKGGQQMGEKMTGHFAIQTRHAQRDFLTTVQT